MSRHAIALAGGRELVVGWDPPLQTYFGVLRAGPELVLCVGVVDLHELYELDDLARALGRHAVHLTPELALRLERDREENRA
ncbi:MAG TPA: hypothetical protein VMY78_07115 [Solirubrobacteraceae bacterium]|nr:hypothetical protein [Solirubrobacteraceae bacterium]